MRDLIDKSKRLPLYLQIAQSLELKIKNGELKAGDALPSENDLSAMLGISPVTVKNGLKILVDKGLIRRISGRGTFVSIPEYDQQHTSTAVPQRQESTHEGTYGVYVCPSIEADWKGLVISGLEEALRAENSHLRFIPNTQDPNSIPGHYLATIRGLVMILCPDDNVDATLTQAEKQSMPVVAVFNTRTEVRADSVDCDQERAGREAAKHLIECGYSRFVHLASGPERLREAQCRGFTRELADRRVAESDTSVIFAWPGESPPDFGKRMANELPMTEGHLGIFAGADEIAAAFIARSTDNNLRAGVDYGLVGCGDLSQYRHLGITTISFAYNAAGQIAAKRLMGLLEETKGALSFSLWPTLIRRESTSTQ